MSKQCIECGSYAINHHCHGRDGSDGELCDVCYWRKRAGEFDKPTMLVIQENKVLKHRCDELLAALEIASASLNDAATKMKWSDIPTAQEILRNADAIGAAIAKAKGGAA